MIELVVALQRLAANTFIERSLAADQCVEALDESTLRLTVRVPDTHELGHWLLGFGPLAVVRSPANLRDALKAMIRQMQENYVVD